MANETKQFDQDAIATIRGLAMDAPAKAKSGHQGTAMALAPLVHTLYSRVLKFDPKDPTWADRDRFVLSAGHASILLYAVLHLTGQGVSLDDLRSFRQLGSLTPGHPEVGHTAGVEVTTGPLGQGLANAVGLAMAERWLSTRFGDELCDHMTYVVAGDGCLQEGISHEAAAFAGHQGLGKLVVIYDDNKITIDGKTDLSSSVAEAARFESYGWHVIKAGQIGEDCDALEKVLLEAKAETARPTLIVLETHCGFPSPQWTDKKEAHGLAVLGDDIAATKQVIGLDPAESFVVLPGVIEHYAVTLESNVALHAAWKSHLGASAQREAFSRQLGALDTAAVKSALPTFEVGSQVATRNALKSCLNATASSLPQLLAGSADLTENTGVALSGATVLDGANGDGTQIYFGIREHAMGAVMNGLALHGGFLPIGGTFFVFSDYLRPAIRLAALSQAHVVYSFTHDSIGVGEDGPTHQPIEHLASLRAMPQLDLFRPADATETAGAWACAVEASGPVALCLSRQNLPVLAGTKAESVEFGGYVLNGEVANPDITLIGTGSEVSLCVKAAAQLAESGISARVVSMPSLGRFLAASKSYRDSVIPPTIPSISIEAGSTFGWSAVADVTLGIDRFGLSAPASEVFSALGITTAALVAQARTTLGGEV
ncbi:MAG: transketolase [Actinomycetes bacterium]